MSLGEEVIIAPAVMKRAADLPKPDSKRTASAAQAPGSDDEAEAPTASVAAGSDEDVSTLNKEIDHATIATKTTPDWALLTAGPLLRIRENAIFTVRTIEH